jgi:hypothetical protein
MTINAVEFEDILVQSQQVSNHAGDKTGNNQDSNIKGNEKPTLNKETKNKSLFTEGVESDNTETSLPLR